MNKIFLNVKTTSKDANSQEIILNILIILINANINKLIVINKTRIIIIK